MGNAFNICVQNLKAASSLYHPGSRAYPHAVLLQDHMLLSKTCLAVQANNRVW